jgi:hypothetical protein
MTTEKIKTVPFRVSFPSVFKPSAIPGSDADPKYSVVMMFPKADKKVGTFIKKVKALLAEEKKAEWGAKAPKKLNMCLTDGDDEEEMEASEGATEGHWLIKGTSVRKPGVILRNGDQATPEEFYAGCWSIATIVFRAYTKGKNGVACHFNNFMKWKDGEPFGTGGASAEDDFGDEIDEDYSDDEDDDEGDDEDI